MTTILSIYAGPHDANLCILQDGKLLINLEKERFTRKKEDGGFTQDFLQKAFEETNITIDDIDVVIIDPKTFPRELYTDMLHSLEGIPHYDTGKLFAKPYHQGSGIFLGKKFTVWAIHHHLAHAAGAFFTSPFSDATVITGDGGGWGSNHSVYVARGGFFESGYHKWGACLGYWWDKIPLYYGVKQPGTLMAMSAYGENDSILKNELLAQLIRYSNSSFPDYSINYGVEKKDGKPVRILDPKEKGDANLAFALQSLTDDVYTGWFAQAVRTGSKNICFGGGLALNCISNSRAMINSGAENIHVPPNPNDAGLALGAALAYHYYILNNKYEPSYFSPYNGIKYNDADIDEAINYAKSISKNIKIRKVNNDDMSTLLAEGNIIARFFGRSESGPRALGHRSYIARPDIPKLKMIMNGVKKREWYRPFAPIVLADEAEALFEQVVNNSYYMNTSTVVKKEWRVRLAGVLHADNTTRPQFIDSNGCENLFELLVKTYDKTGIPAILNTSFNIKEPLVETPLDAVKTFINSSDYVKFLQINELLLEK